MDMIASMLKLCELATDHGTSSEYTEGLGVVLPGVPTANPQGVKGVQSNTHFFLQNIWYIIGILDVYITN